MILMNLIRITSKLINRTITNPSDVAILIQSSVIAIVVNVAVAVAVAVVIVGAVAVAVAVVVGYPFEGVGCLNDLPPA